MSHLDDGRLRALIDEELGDTDAGAVRLHLEDCDACRHRMVELEGRATLVAQALGQLDTAAPTAGARDAVLERIGSSPREERVGPTRPVASVNHPGSRSRGRALHTPLARAAIVVLFLGAGVVTALPASPVREWIAAGWGRASDFFESSDDPGTPAGPTQEATPPTLSGSVGTRSGTAAGVRLDFTGKEISIVLRRIEAGTLIVVRLVPGGEAGAFADDPATFRTAEARIEVIGAAGRVFVDLPRDAGAASIEVNGGIYLSKEGDRIDVTGPIEARTTEEIHLRVR
jgi:hypothetical protein